MSLEKILDRYIKEDTDGLFNINKLNPVYDELKEAVNKLILEKEPSLLEGDVLIRDSMLSGIGVIEAWYPYPFISWLIHRTKQTSSSQAVEDFKRWFNKDTTKFCNAIIVLGPKIRNVISVNENITIYPIYECPYKNLISDLNIYEDSQCRIQRNGKAELFTPAFVVVHNIDLPRICPKEGIDNFDYNFNEIEDIARIVSVINRVPFYIYRRTSFLHENEANPCWGGVTCYGQINDAFFEDVFVNYNLNVQLVSNSENYDRILFNLMNKWNCLSVGKQTKLRIAIDRFSNSNHRLRVEDKLIELRIALDVLLLKGNESSQSSSIEYIVRSMYNDEDNIIHKVAYDIYNAASGVMHEGQIRSAILRGKGKSRLSLIDLMNRISRESFFMIEYFINNDLKHECPKKNIISKIFDVNNAYIDFYRKINNIFFN